MDQFASIGPAPPKVDPVDEMIGIVAAQHGVLLDKRDPSLMFVTLTKFAIVRGVEEATGRFQAETAVLLANLGGRIEAMVQSSVESAAEQQHALLGTAIQKEVGAVVVRAVEEQLNQAVERIKREIDLDLEAAGASAATIIARVNHANTRPMRIYWMTMGLLAASVCVGLGFALAKLMR